MSKRPELWICAVLFILESVWGYAFTVVTPPFEGPDEYYHYCYIALIAHNRALPKPYPLTPTPYTDRHPPLYYLLGAALVWDLPVSCYQAPGNPFAVYDHSTPVFDNRNLTALTKSDLQAVDIAGLRRVRLLSVALGSLTIVVAYLTARMVFDNNRRWAVTTAVLVAALPPFAWISGFVNNDNLSIFIGTLITFYCVRVVRQGAVRRRTALLMGTLAGVSLMTKFSLWLFIPVMLAILLRDSLRRTSIKSGLVNGFAFVGTMLAISAWWFVRNALLVPELAGLGQLNWLGPIRWAKRPSLETLLVTAGNQLTGVWSRYGYQVELPNWVAIAGVGLAATALIGLLVHLFKANFRIHPDRPMFWIGVIGALDLASGMYAVWLSRDAGQGRFLYPGIVSLGLLLILGWSQFCPKAFRPHGYPASVTGGMVIFSLAGFFLVYRTAYQLPRLLPPDKLPPKVMPTDFAFENVAKLVGASVAPAKAQPGGEAIVTLCWKPLSQTSSRFETVTILDHRLNVVASRSTLPGLGRYQTTDWKVGQPFCDDIGLRLPANTASQNQYLVSAGLSGLQASQSDGKTVDPAIIGEITVPSSILKLPPEIRPLKASLEYGLALLGYTLTYTSTGPGSSVQLDLFWKTDSQLPESYHVFVHWLDAQGRLIAQSDGIPRDGAYPTDAWGSNEIIEDSHTLVISDGSAAGVSQFSVGMYEYPSGARLSTTGPLSKDNTITFPGPDIQH